MRITTICGIALALLLTTAVERPAHALISAIGYLGYGHTFGDNVAHDNFGPTLEIGGSIGLPFVDFDVTYWNVLDNTADSQSQIRFGARLSPPIIPLYGRVAVGIPFDGNVRDALGTDILFGAGFTAFSLAVIKINIEADYHYWTDGHDFHPLEIKAGVVVGF